MSNKQFKHLRTDSSRGGLFLFFVDYFQSYWDTMTYYIPSKSLYFSLSIDINVIITICDA